MSQLKTKVLLYTVKSHSDALIFPFKTKNLIVPFFFFSFFFRMACVLGYFINSLTI